MEIHNCSYKTKCEINGCKNLATYSIKNSVDKKFGIDICEECAKDLYACLGTIAIPKSIPAPFKNQKKIGDKKI